MFFRIRAALGIALLAALVASIAVLAKGGFSFISVTGGDLKDELRFTDPDLTNDFFAFADFSQARTSVPKDPGTGYEITRYYIDGTRETAFDRLHYYPEAGLVYYDGIVNGWSGYDGEWYTAQPGMRDIFESALPGKAKPIDSAAQQPAPVSQSQSNASNLRTQTILLIVVVIGSVVILLLASWFRKPATR